MVRPSMKKPFQHHDIIFIATSATAMPPKHALVSRDSSPGMTSSLGTALSFSGRSSITARRGDAANFAVSWATTRRYDFEDDYRLAVWKGSKLYLSYLSPLDAATFNCTVAGMQQGRAIVTVLRFHCLVRPTISYANAYIRLGPHTSAV